MRIPSFCFMSLLIAIATACLLAAAAPENSSASYDNTTNATLRVPTLSNSSSNSSPNLSAMNGSLLNASGTKNIVPETPFMVGGDAKVRTADRAGIDGYPISCSNVSVRTSETPQSNKTAFMIKGYTRPTRDSKNGSQCSLTAASLSRGVEGTTHGYVTYYN